MIQTQNWEESKSLSELQYIKYVVNNNIDDYPVDDIFNELRSVDPFFRYWNIRIEGMNLYIGYRSECDGNKVYFNADLNVFLKRALEDDNLDLIQWGTLLKFYAIIKTANECKYFKEINDKLIVGLIQKKITPIEYADKITKINLESTLIAVYSVLSYIVNVETDNKEYFMNQFLEDIYPKYILPRDILTTPQELLENIKMILEGKNEDFIDRYIKSKQSSDEYLHVLNKGNELYQ